MGVKTILDVTVKNVEKRRYPTKHYVYVLEVRWSEGTTTVVFRRYSDFFEFQCQLLERFPEESGAKDPAARMIPFLPGKKLFGRSHIRTVAEKRKEKIDLYCRTLVRLPPKISEDPFILEFFEVRDTDINKPGKPDENKQQSVQEISGPLILERYVAIADYDKQKKNECSLKAGQTVEVVDKNQNGWWFVNVDDFHEGWVPATYLEPLYGSEDPRSQKLDEEEIHITLNAYTAHHDDEVSFEKGVLVEVFEKGFDGWWKIRYQGKEGIAPAAYLHKYVGSVGGVTTGAQVVGSVKEAVLSTSVNVTSSSNQPTSPRPSARPTFNVKPLPPKSSSNARPTSPKSDSNTTTPTSPKSGLNATTPTSPNSSASVSTKEILNASLALSSARRNTTSSPPLPATSSLSPPPSTGVSAASSAVPAPSPSPKPAEAPEKPKFAPTFHSQPKPFIDKEPIYAPTPRRKSFKKPPLKKRDPPAIASKPQSSTSTSPTTSPTSEQVNFELDFPEPVYEIIPEPEEEIYLTLAEFSAANAQDGLSFGPGEACTVITKNPTGWWFVELNGQEGWVPSSYLERRAKTPTPKSPVVPALPSRDKLNKKLSAAKKNPSPPAKRRETSAVKKSPPVKRSSLKRSNSTDSLLVDKPKRPVKRAHSPPTITRNTGWQPQPAKKPVLKTATATRPTLSKPNSATRSPRPARSPRPIRRSNEETLRPAISGPVAVKSSPTLHHASKQRSTTLATKTTAPGLKAPPSNVRTTSIGSRPPPPKPTAGPGQSKPQPPSVGHRRGSSDGPRPSLPKRRLSNENMQQNGITKHKSELEKKLQQRKAGTLHPTTASAGSQPKKTSPPQRPKPPPPTSTGSATLPGKGQGPPRRPEPPKIKRPPPPRPGKLPVNSASKRTIFVTVADYSAASDGCLEFREGEVVEVIEKSDDGWWFVKIGTKEGWVPSTFLEEKEDTPPEQRKPPKPNLPPPKPGDSLPTPKEQVDSVPEAVVAPKPKPRPRPRKSAAPSFFRAVSSYEAPINDDSAIPIVKGRVYEVMDKNENGWWLIKDGDKEGWAPGTYFDPV